MRGNMQHPSYSIETLATVDKPDDRTIVAANPEGVMVTIDLRETGGQSSVVRTAGGQEEVLYSGSAPVAGKVFAAVTRLLDGNAARSAEPQETISPEIGGLVDFTKPLPKPSPLSRDPEPGKGFSATTLVLGTAVALFLGVGATIAVLEPDIAQRFMKGTQTPVMRTVVPDEPAAPAEDTRSVEERNAAEGPRPTPETAAPATPPAQPVVDLPSNMRTETPPGEPVDVGTAGPQSALEMIREATAGARDTGAETPVPAPAAETAETTVPGPAPATAVAETPSASGTGDEVADSLGERAVEAAEQFEAAQAEANRAVSESGTEQAATELELMKQALAILTAGNKLTPEQAEGLPHDLAARLRAAGAIQTLEEAAAIAGPEATYSIVRLPTHVIDSHRDADGIPTIPQENSWVARGGVVNVPLPGGGDITSPDDFDLFGLEP